MSSRLDSGRSGRWALLLPVLALAVCVRPLIVFQLPNIGDVIHESYEPVKTLRFFYSRGQEVHKWGPLPSFLFAPVYAIQLGWWRCTGQFPSPSTDYPYGLPRPHEQMGAMVLAARITVATCGAVALALLTRQMGRLTGAPWLAAVTVLVCVCTSPPAVTALGCTHPDGLMLTFATLAMACYAAIALDGFTRRRAVLMSVLAVASVSCKETTSLLFVLPYAGLLAGGLWQRRADRDASGLFLRDYATAVGAGLLAYALINIAYAPASWWTRMHIVFGPLKDPSIWAASTQTPGSYLRDAAMAWITVLGYPGVAMAVAAAVATAFTRPPGALLLWLPLLSHTILVTLVAGYMPTYFMVPVGMAAVLPVAAVFAHCGRHARRIAAASATWVAAGATALCLATVCSGAAYVRLWLEALPVSLVERWVVENADRQTPINLFSMHPRRPGSSRLSYLGYRIDGQPLQALIADPSARPPLVLVDQEHLDWLADFARRPARARMFQELTGHDYSGFQGLEALGYVLVEKVRPRWHAAYHLLLTPGAAKLANQTLCVYRLGGRPTPATRVGDFNSSPWR